MKRLMTLMLGLSFLVGTVAVTFAQDQGTKTEKKKGKKKGKKKKGGEDTTKGSR
ncbi:MAG TPA: hypothetical protein VJ732_14540 [Bryobacteraceae bacterium]|nr:hypothetical protein [Bryobacteraceae bacterium]